MTTQIPLKISEYFIATAVSIASSYYNQNIKKEKGKSFPSL
jgi:hypothetical protein